jgi:hypothetical protein
MRTEKRLLYKYMDYLNALSKAEITFKKKEDFEVCNNVLKEIKALREQMVKEILLTNLDATQIKMKFRKR